jgi:hypothetical protein
VGRDGAGSFERCKLSHSERLDRGTNAVVAHRPDASVPALTTVAHIRPWHGPMPQRVNALA